MMTKNDFDKWARYIRDLEYLGERIAVAQAVIDLNDNPRFDKERFVKACGLEWAF